MRSTAALAAGITAALAACITTDQDVLSVGVPLTACSEVAMRTSDNQACSFTDVCAEPDPTDPGCCQTFVSCQAGLLQFDRYCTTDCQACRDDSQCVAGRQICDGNTCVACRGPAECPPCDPGLVPLTRNGCATCQCAPPSECTDGTMSCDGSPTSICYPGMVCAPGCVPGDPGCCANVCAERGCPSPAPLGCDTICTDPGCDPGNCITTACECVGARWECTGSCGTPTGMCFQPVVR